VSMMFENWTGTALMVGSIVMDVLAAVNFYCAWVVIPPKRSRVPIF
jgi:hypothetical protein